MKTFVWLCRHYCLRFSSWSGTCQIWCWKFVVQSTRVSVFSFFNASTHSSIALGRSAPELTSTFFLHLFICWFCCLLVYVCVCVCMCVYVCVCVCVCVFVCVCVLCVWHVCIAFAVFCCCVCLCVSVSVCLFVCCDTMRAHLVTCTWEAEQYLHEIAQAIDAFLNALPEKVYRGSGKEGITWVLSQVHWIIAVLNRVVCYLNQLCVCWKMNDMLDMYPVILVMCQMCENYFVGDKKYNKWTMSVVSLCFGRVVHAIVRKSPILQGNAVIVFKPSSCAGCFLFIWSASLSLIDPESDMWFCVACQVGVRRCYAWNVHLILSRANNISSGHRMLP